MPTKSLKFDFPLDLFTHIHIPYLFCISDTEGNGAARFSKYDIGLHFENISMSNDLKYELLKHIWKPDPTNKFPVTVQYGKNRSFCYAWLQEFPWLAYSAKEDGAFCLFCVLFGRTATANDQKLDKLYKSPLNDWTVAKKRLVSHNIHSTMHKHASNEVVTFKQMMDQKTLPVDKQVNEKAKRQIELNRTKLKSIVKTIVLCGKQNLPLRGHRDDSTNDKDENNSGNFLALLKFRVDSGDKILDDHFKNAPRNATYKSKTIQNELISCLGWWIRQQIIAEL